MKLLRVFWYLVALNKGGILIYLNAMKADLLTTNVMQKSSEMRPGGDLWPL